jgi:hypothetical protein
VKFKTSKIHLLLISITLLGCAAPGHKDFTDDPSRVALRYLYSVAPELRRERLESVNDCVLLLPSSGNWDHGGDVDADFRYLDDPESHPRLLVLHRTVSADGTTATIRLELCHSRKFFRPFKDGGGQERWAILDRRTYRTLTTRFVN